MSEMYKDFVKAQKEFEKATKEATNPHFRSKYADLAACVDAVKGALNNNSFALMQATSECETGVKVSTIFMHTSGDKIDGGVLYIPATKNDAHAYGSALTYARRYSLLAASGIAPEDDDGNMATQPNNNSINNGKLTAKRNETREFMMKKFNGDIDAIKASLKEAGVDAVNNATLEQCDKILKASK